MDHIKFNPMLKVERPKLEKKYKPVFYSSEELNKLFSVLMNDIIEFPVTFTTFYGLRRSELLGLTWDKVDFENKCITIESTFHQYSVNGKQVFEYREMTKNDRSRRTLPLIPIFETILKNRKEEQEISKKQFRKAYNPDFLNFVFVDELGNIYKPNYISSHFSLIVKNNGLKKITFHGLRHSCVSLLLKRGLNMKEIQEYLGHSNFNTTADIYAHLECNSKINATKQMLKTGVNYDKKESVFFNLN